MRTVRIPAKFYDDHVERGLPAPPIVIAYKRNGYVIDPDRKHFAELVDDAEFYAHPYGPDNAPDIVKAAKAMLKALEGRSHVRKNTSRSG